MFFCLPSPFCFYLSIVSMSMQQALGISVPPVGDMAPRDSTKRPIHGRSSTPSATNNKVARLILTARLPFGVHCPASVKCLLLFFIGWLRNPLVIGHAHTPMDAFISPRLTHQYADI